MDQFEVLSWKLPGGTKENHGPQDIGSSNQNLNQAPSE
jgi:hypothetical protein